MGKSSIMFLSFLLATATGCQNISAPHKRAGPSSDSTSRREDAAPVVRTFDEGDGPPLVMLGGGVAGAAGFAPHATLLSGEFRVIRLESLRMEAAQGGSPLPRDYSIRAESIAMTHALDRLGITQPVHVVGHSFGALVALDFALAHPDRIRSLVLAEPPAFWLVPPEDLRADADMRAMVDLVRTFRPSDEPTDDQLAQFQARLGKADAQPPPQGDPAWKDWTMRRRALRGLAAVADHTDDPRRVSEFRRPVLIVTGAKTVPFHRRINDVLANALPNVERAELDGGHGAPSTAAEAFVAVLRAFFVRTPEDGDLSPPPPV